MIFKTIVLSLFTILLLQLNAQEIKIGKAWEFNEDSNFEGITLSSNFKDSLVENGMLKATVANVFPFLKSEEFELEAKDYGLVQIRMKIAGATSGKLNWYNDTGAWGFIIFEASGDSTFQEFELPVFLNDKWTGKITKIMSLGFNPTVGSQVEIDYIRIVRKGAKPSIVNLNPRRTIFKQNVEIPLYAQVRNDGDEEAILNSELALPDGVTLVSGELGNNHGIMYKELTDTLNWTIMFDNLGEYELSLKLFNESDTTEKKITLNVTDQYWVQDKFFLSVWHSPLLTTDAYDYFNNANFEMVLSVPPDEASVIFAEQHGMEYQLKTGYLVGERDLIARDNTVPEDLTAEDLAKLDGMISTFKDEEGVLGYHITDEPNAKAFPNLGRVVSYLREKDPTRLSFINIFSNYADEELYGTETYHEHIEQFLNIVKPELLSYDHYHFYNNYDGGGYFNNLGIIRRWALAYDIPFSNTIQAIGTNGTIVDHLDWRTPNEGEHRWLVYSSLAYGAKAIIWYSWESSHGVTSSSKRDELYASIQQLNLEINNIGDILINLNSDGVYHYPNVPAGAKLLPANKVVKEISDGSDMLIGIFKHQDGDDYLMLMNKDYNASTTATIKFNYILDGFEVFDADKNLWEAQLYDNSSGSSSFEYTFEPGDGKLFKLSGETLVGVSSVTQLPTEFILEQNYPNPFNPSTTIKYSIPIVETRRGVSPLVTLKIYDILGREVTTLVNKEQNPGNYEVKFDASTLSSGLYLYRISTSGYTTTKKMILLR